MAYVYQQYSASDALSGGWRVFRARWWLFAGVAAVPALVDHVLRFVLGVPMVGLGSFRDRSLDDLGTFALVALLALTVLAAGVAASALVSRWALAGVDHDTRSPGAQAKDITPRARLFFGWSLAVAGLSLVGVLFCFVGIFAVQLFTLWVPFLVLEGRSKPLEESFEGVREYLRESGLVFAILVAAHIGGVVLAFLLRPIPLAGPLAVGVAVATVWAWTVCCQASIYRASSESEPNATWDPSTRRDEIVGWAMEGTSISGPPPPPVAPPPAPPADLSQPPPGW